MTVPQSTTTAESSLWREALHIARYYLGNRWVLLALGVGGVITGLSFGGWAWLVAAGLAPILVAILPCLVMCGLGVCTMCLSGKKQTTASHDAADAATSSAALGVAKMDRPMVGASSCCDDGGIETQSTQTKQLQPTDERRGSHA